MSLVITPAVGQRRCSHCGSRQVRRSRRRGIVELLVLPLFLLRPYRCKECWQRHFGFTFLKHGVQRATQYGHARETL